MKRIGVACVVLAAALLTMTGSAWAEASTHCVKATKVGKKYTGGYVDKSCTAPSAKHEGKYEFIKASSLSEPEQEELKALLKYVKVVPSGVDSKPTVRVSGANVQIVNGAGSTATTNGEGNLVIGYDEFPGTQTGSHNLMLGYEGQEYTGFGSILGGLSNKALGGLNFVVGTFNTASGGASVSGGEGNTASGEFSSVSGGDNNTASGIVASVSGGLENKASGVGASVSGGASNLATGREASVSGGQKNTASNEAASVSGGYKNTAGFKLSSIFGGKELTTTKEYEAIP